MHLKYLVPIALSALAKAQNLAELLASNNGTLSSLNAHLAAQLSLSSTLTNSSNITILAPNNEAFSSFQSTPAGSAASNTTNFVAALLQYHVLDGTYHVLNFTTSRPMFIPTLLTNETYANVTGGQRVELVRNGTNVTILSGLVERSRIVTANLNFTGGTLHIIDRVLTIPTSDSSTAIAANLTSFAGALAASSLLNTLDFSLTDVTIFAPSNDAFSSIGSAIGNLTVQELGSVLGYHVVNGTVGYSSLLGNMSLGTLEGGNVTVRVENGSVFVNSAKVLHPDFLVGNGVVHVIDGVLNPNNTAATPNPSTTTAAFPGATSVTTSILTSGVPSQTTTIQNAPTGAAGAISSSSQAGAVRAWQTGVVGLGALFGGVGVWANH